jgi:hypothetical protein
MEGKRRECRFRQREITRAIRATRAAGVAVDRVEIEPSGKVIVYLANGVGEAPKISDADQVLKRKGKLTHHEYSK